MAGPIPKTLGLRCTPNLSLWACIPYVWVDHFKIEGIHVQVGVSHKFSYVIRLPDIISLHSFIHSERGDFCEIPNRISKIH